MSLSIQRLSPSVLNTLALDKDPYRPFTLPLALDRFHKIQPSEGYWVAAEARLDESLIGLALAQIFLINQTAQLYSLVVQEEYRQKGIGLALFQFLESSLRESDLIRGFGFEYEKNDPSALAMEKIVAHQEWPVPKPYLVRCHFTLATFNPKWLYFPYKIPAEMKLFAWKNLKEEEKHRIAFMGDQGMFLPYLLPFREEETIHYSTSLGLRYRGQIMGWCITHLIDPQTLQYSILYLDKDFYFSGYGIYLLAQSILLLKHLPLPYAIFQVNLEHTDPSWRRFVKKRLVPLSDKVERMKWAMKFYPIILR